MAFSVVLGVAFAASGQYFVGGSPADAPAERDLGMLVAAPHNGGLAGPAYGATSSAEATGNTSATTTKQAADGDKTSAQPATTSSSSASAETPSSTSTTAGERTTEKQSAGKQVTDESAPRAEATSNHTPPRTPPPSARDDNRANRVVELVNYVRQRAGCDSVRTDGRLTTAAQRHSDDMSARGYFSHTSPEGETFGDRARDAGYPSPGAENIARGPSEPEDVMRMWMESPGHRQNIMNCDLETIGVGVTSRGWYWTQAFGY